MVRSCLWCGTPFYGNREYCSWACRQEAENLVPLLTSMGWGVEHRFAGDEEQWVITCSVCITGEIWRTSPMHTIGQAVAAARECENAQRFAG
jgi:hypothetical protein